MLYFLLTRKKTPIALNTVRVPTISPNSGINAMLTIPRYMSGITVVKSCTIPYPVLVIPPFSATTVTLLPSGQFTEATYSTEYVPSDKLVVFNRLPLQVTLMFASATGFAVSKLGESYIFPATIVLALTAKIDVITNKAITGKINNFFIFYLFPPYKKEYKINLKVCLQI